MEIGYLRLLRMASFVSRLLFLVHLPMMFASEIVIKSYVCGSDLLAYTTSNSNELFYINENLVDKTLFCKAVQFHYADRCIFKDYFWRDYCALPPSIVLAADLSLKAGRKVLQHEVSTKPTKHDQGQEFPPEHMKNDPKSMSTPEKFGIAGSGVFVLCCAFLCPCFRKQRKPTAHEVLTKDPHSMDSISSFEKSSTHDKVQASPLRVPPSPSRFSMSPKLATMKSVQLNMSQVVRATQNFSPALKIGEGGFGTVYRAQLEDGQVVAIKRAKKEHFENLHTEFSSEVELLAKIDHQCLVKLLGYVDRGSERLIITEYVPNGTLRDHLDGFREKILDFKQRLEISIDIAHGLTYLHVYAEKMIIHRDVKSSNILLTESMRAKVADFGFAKLGSSDVNETHISTKVKGTVGYLDPEYMKTYQLTPKSDVYSFGILLIEILTGRRPVELKKPADERVTIRWAFKKFDGGDVLGLVDPLMKEVLDVNVLKKIFRLAIQCAAPVRIDRPDMKAVGEKLWEIRADYLNRRKRG